MQLINRVVNKLLLLVDPELKGIKSVINETVATSNKSHQTDECDHIFINRLLNSPKALKMPFWENHFEWKIIKEYPEIKGYILDFGCGSGHSDIMLARNGYKVHGIDLSPVGIAIASFMRSKENTSIQELVNFEAVDVFEPRCSNQLYDAAWSAHVFEHIADPAPILKALKNWLKPGAFMLISVPLGYAYDDPGHVNHFANGEELSTFLGDTVTVTRIDISQEFQVIRALCRF